MKFLFSIFYFYNDDDGIWHLRFPMKKVKYFLCRKECVSLKNALNKKTTLPVFYSLKRCYVCSLKKNSKKNISLGAAKALFRFWHVPWHIRHVILNLPPFFVTYHVRPSLRNTYKKSPSEIYGIIIQNRGTHPSKIFAKQFAW